MSYSQNAVNFTKPWKVWQISTQTFIASWRSCWQCPFPQRLLSGHSVQWGVLRHIYELRWQKTDWTCSHEYSHRFGNRQQRSTKAIWCNWQKGNAFWLCECECACVSLAFYLSPLNNVTYKHIGLAETNKQTTQEATRISGPMNRRDSCSINCCCYW